MSSYELCLKHIKRINSCVSWYIIKFAFTFFPRIPIELCEKSWWAPLCRPASERDIQSIATVFPAMASPNAKLATTVYPKPQNGIIYNVLLYFVEKFHERRSPTNANKRNDGALILEKAAGANVV